MMSDLKPCPFCGGNANIIAYPEFDPKRKVYVQCEKCGISTRMKDTPKEAFEAWNRRVERTAKAENLREEYNLDGRCFITYGDCNICGEQVEYPDKYCHECGAKLDWSDYG